MQKHYNSNVIFEFLNIFKVRKIIISGVTDQYLINNIFQYNGEFTQINTLDEESIGGNPLKLLPKLSNYDAIFIDDDSNWYTVFNELEIIKKSNDEFPLVFICNNNFPNKRRDSYLNPNEIPSKFRQKYTNKLTIQHNDEKITITDGFYHSFEENTPKNGVLTAIEDFLKENVYIGRINFNFTKEIVILYSKSQINHKRISILAKSIKNEYDGYFSDKLIENQLLISYINKYNLYDDLDNVELELSKKNNIINDYESKVRNLNNEMYLKDVQLEGFENKLSLKDSQIKNFESKLVNRDRTIGDLQKEIKINDKNYYLMIKNKDNELRDLTDEFHQKELYYNNTINSLSEDLKDNKNEYLEQIKIKDSQINFLKIDLNQNIDNFDQKEEKFNNLINSKNAEIKQKNNQIKIQENELNDERKKLNSLKHSYAKQLSKIDNNEYCINCFKEEISNNHVEIKYLQNNSFAKILLNPFAYLFIIFKSHPSEISLNLKLYKVLKDSKCFDVGFYLNKNKDLLKSKWIKYFSPELHYVCKGFEEKRTFNKKYFNNNSKSDLLEYILTCGK